MRSGKNPIHDLNIFVKKAYHRVIIPVYIPYLGSYYKDSFEILKLSIESLLSTIHDNTLVTIINNACCQDVYDYLKFLLSTKKIDQIIDYSENKGKVDPVIAAMRGSLEELITITDADVYFISGWQEEVEDLFLHIPFVGMVSPMPFPKMRNFYSSFSWFYGFFTNSLVRFQKFDISGLNLFKQSIGDNSNFSNEEIFPIGIKYKGKSAIIGAGHFCATYHKNVISEIPFRKSGSKFIGAEIDFLDKPVVNAGLMRLATFKTYVYHLGNTIDNEFYCLKFQNIRGNTISLNSWTFPRKSFKSKLVTYLFSKRVLTKLISKLFSKYF